VLAGGKGKTTIAKALYNLLLREGMFARAAFVELDKFAALDAAKLKSILKQLGEKPEDDNDLSQYSASLHSVMKKEKVLLVIDNVSSDKDLEQFLPEEWCRDGMVIVTTRLLTLRCGRVCDVVEICTLQYLHYFDRRLTRW
jgi:NB-ARC domain